MIARKYFVHARNVVGNATAITLKYASKSELQRTFCHVKNIRGTRKQILRLKTNKTKNNCPKTSNFDKNSRRNEQGKIGNECFTTLCFAALVNRFSEAIAVKQGKQHTKNTGYMKVTPITEVTL